MAEVTKASEAELARRESHIREYTRPRELLDPYTWSYPAKGAALTYALGIIGAKVYNAYFRKPWNYQLLPRLCGLTVFAGIGYFLGTVREHHYTTRDAVLEHYQELHCDDFVNVNDRYGRQYAAVMLPWYPKRTQYRSFD